MAKLEDVDLHELEQTFWERNWTGGGGADKKHCFEWFVVNRRMEFKQLKDKQARGLCIHSFIHSGLWGREATMLEAIYAAIMLEMRKHMGERCLV